MSTPYTIRSFDTVTSTNTLLIEEAEKGANEGLVFVAKSQTGGKGTKGRRWCSEEGGLYFSILLRPKLPIETIQKLTQWAGVTVLEALEKETALPLSLRGVNDIMLGGKKLGWILTEAGWMGEDLGYVVVGVGVNVNQRSFPEELADRAISLFQYTQKEWEIKRIQGVLLDSLFCISSQEGNSPL